MCQISYSLPLVGDVYLKEKGMDPGTYEYNPKSAHWLTPLNSMALPRTPGTRVGLLYSVASMSPSNF